MQGASAFPGSYGEARRRFLEAAVRAGCTVEACPMPGLGPNGEDLAVDVARWTPPLAETLLVLSSGLHGVEGRFGSAVQIALLEEWTRRRPPDAAVLMLHALNPYGFAWSRRVDGDNVDLNRNFLLPGEAYAGHASLYARLDPIINPPSPPGRFDGFAVVLGLAAARHGTAALKQALVTGQYDFPKGLFFGGHGPSPLARAFDTRFPAWIGAARRVVHLDLHTGLGPFARHRLLVDADVPDADVARMGTWFGASIVERDDPRHTSYRARGTLRAWCRHRARDLPYFCACAEFGTYGPLRVLAGLRAENRAVQGGRIDDVASRRARAALEELFCPASDAWRTRVLRDARALAASALDALRTM